MSDFYSAVYFDTEFIENGETILPLSIGLTTDWPSFEELYIVFDDVDPIGANDWVQENVLPYLYTGPYQEMSRSRAADLIEEWVTDAVGKPQFWADYAAYDWVVLCQLYGKMIDLPDTYPMFCRDVQNLKDLVKYPCKLPENQGREHNALDDAKNVKDRVSFLFKWAREREQLI